jgi:hypothetical protein
MLHRVRTAEQVVLVAGALASHPDQALADAAAGLRAATDGLSLVVEARCWRWGWHGWGWYAYCTPPANPCVRCQWHWGVRNCWRVC